MEYPVLKTCKSLKSEFKDLSKIPITSDTFSIGRGLRNSAIVPFITISRSHCIFKRVNHNAWTIQDNSTFGIQINGQNLGKGMKKTLSNGDIIILDKTEEFIYKFVNEPDDGFEIPRKRIRMDSSQQNNDILDDVKLKFEESQSCEIKHIEEKIQNAKQMQTTSMILKQQLQTDMNRKIQQLEREFSSQIENLKGEKFEVERQKIILEEERDLQLASVKQEMEQKICQLMEQILEHNQTESRLLEENNLLKEKLNKEREEFLVELNRENTSKQDMLDKLKAKVQEQEDVRMREREEFVVMLKRETELLTLAKEKELKELGEQKIMREKELTQELSIIKKNLEDQIQQTEQEKLKAEQFMREQMEHMQKLNNEENIKMEKLIKEREEVQNRLNEAQSNAEKSLKELRLRVTERETELAILAAERIEKQVSHSSEVISNLQQQLAKVQNQLQSVESEKNTILENLCAPEEEAGCSAKQTVMTQVGELMESELQCSICAELFVTATMLNCSHTFCKYCISMWKKKKKDCPICRAPITSECRTLVLDSFIEKMVQNLSEEMKKKREAILKSRKDEEKAILAQKTATQTRNRRRNRNSRSSTTISLTRTTASTTSPTLTVDLTWVPTQTSTQRPRVCSTRELFLHIYS
ncbi:unnamed protein product [Chrysodeixis includens]|uniref:E3 ubiquitin-protein ligase CHFR n=1 Tax=Chrysodeixis includens TaxID=689277 RepID=A0A9P0FTG0_CHRIL|nr:unnamed protein product [Chrysodeixis includens]